MRDRTHATQARENLDRIDVDGDEELATLRADAVAAIETLIEALETSDGETTARTEPSVPDSWDDAEWEAKVDAAREKAGLGGFKGTLTTKNINGHDYYYLQWREGETVKSQYVAPVDPA